LWGATGGWLGLVVAGAILGLFGNLAGASTIHAVVVDRVPWAVGRAIGLMSTGYFLGALVAPWAFGAAADATGGYDASWAGCVAALSGSALCFVAIHRWVALPTVVPAEHVVGPRGRGVPGAQVPRDTSRG
jgi:hypothetical protein